jgi:hypothetical protein
VSKTLKMFLLAVALTPLFWALGGFLGLNAWNSGWDFDRGDLTAAPLVIWFYWWAVRRILTQKRRR